jgi:hypothetical protein
MYGEMDIGNGRRHIEYRWRIFWRDMIFILDSINKGGIYEELLEKV